MTIIIYCGNLHLAKMSKNFFSHYRRMVQVAILHIFLLLQSVVLAYYLIAKIISIRSSHYMYPSEMMK